MSGSFPTGGFGSGGFGTGGFNLNNLGLGNLGNLNLGSMGANGEGIWQAVDQLRARFEKGSDRGGFEKREGTRVGKGDVRVAVLALLAEQPMHGYQIIREIEERSGGTWKPSAGSVYPTLQLLADEGLISSEESNGRKTYSLTEAGHVSVAANPSNPWSTQASGDDAKYDNAKSDHGKFGALPKAGLELAQAAAQVGRSGTPEQVKEAVTVLEEARRRIYSILAQD
ncbi:PadR family transcriptional regulator [Subtercola boreus]|uniref:PadR family transcriptional regulator n=1 Tax=Subtercola boreus TaxID=120213 RepID=A0A3E0VZ07_9MICO|nr:PadR family transcriptional regulator [Subtercola boreus]